jgi:DNA-directed RNA polymerase specialized sigma24 family protein
MHAEICRGMEGTMMTEPDAEGYELFRRAIVERDEQAWATIHARYRPLLAAWACRCGASARTSEAAADIADRALARAWAALTPASFTAFPTLAHLLAYLRICVRSTAIDCARAQFTAERSVISTNPIASPEQIVLANFDRTTLWHMVLGLIASPTERVALIMSCVYGLPPRAIQARYPQLFPDVAAVYVTKRNLFYRLRQHQEVRRLCEELVSG